jgi:glycosyltransferase involved in cell wall biosynthesis
MYPPHHFGGYELVWRSAVAHLREGGHAVRVLTTDFRRPEIAPGTPEDDDVHRELRWWWRDHAWPHFGLRERLAIERQNAQTFARHAESFAPDVVAWFAMGGLTLSLLEHARRRGIPAVAFVQDDWLVYGPGQDAWARLFRRRGGRLLAPAAERATGVPLRLRDPEAIRWLFVSASTRERAAELGGRRPARSEIAHSGFDRTWLRERSDAPAWRWRLLIVGRLDPRKGIETAIAALGLLPPEATLTIAGDGEPAYERRLRELAARIGSPGRVTFAGGQDRAGLAGLYADADAVVFPVTWEEPWGLVPLEAMAVGRPVVATGRGGSAEYLADGVNSLLFAAGDAAALAAAVRRLAGDPALRAQLIAGGHETAPRHTDAVFNAAAEAALLDEARLSP